MKDYSFIKICIIKYTKYFCFYFDKKKKKQYFQTILNIFLLKILIVQINTTTSDFEEIEFYHV